MARISPRQRRINEALREVIAETVQRELSDPRLSMVTITGVRASEDMSVATVYWTVYDASRREGAAAALTSAAGVLQGRVGRELRTRNTPHLRFEHDDLQENADRLTRLIDEVTADIGGAAPASDTEERETPAP